MDEIIKQSDIKAALDAGRELASKPFEVNGTPFLVVPDGHTIKDYPELRQTPQHIAEQVRHATALSFNAYYRRYATPATVIFLDSEENRFTAIFDYHGDNTPGWCKHKSIYTLKPTVEWRAWRDMDGKVMTQAEFGRFIEKNLLEIISPANGEMLEIALSLQAKTSVDFSKAIRLDNGQTQFQYVETIEGKAGTQGQLKIPETFLIGLVMFEGGDPYQLEARFRYRIKDGNLTLWYELVRPHKVIEANIRETEALIVDDMDVGLFYKAVL